jgi:hypothetical protein
MLGKSMHEAAEYRTTYFEDERTASRRGMGCGRLPPRPLI